jgi:t-SNARE complex subunit (syntaxin)
MPPVGFEPTISAGDWPQTYVLDRAATETGIVCYIIIIIIIII